MSAGQVAAELAQEIADLTRKWEIEREIIRRYIGKAPLEEVENKIMVLRYVECRLWRTIEVSLGYSKPHVMRIHNSALGKLILHETS